MATTRFADHITAGVFASRPAASAVPAGSLYSSTDTGIIYQSDGVSTWSTYATLGTTGGIPASILDTKGDLIAASAADTAAKLAAGANGKYLVTDSAQSAGLKYENVKTLELKVFDDATALSTGDGKLIFCIPIPMGGMDLTAANAFVTTVSSSGLPTVQIRNITQAVDMLSTRITIDVSEFRSFSPDTPTTPPVIDTGNDDVATGDLIAIDVDVSGTGAKGLGVILTFSQP